MKRYIHFNCFYSNCLITALIIKYRLKGKLVKVIRWNPFLIHFLVRKGPYLIDFTPACHVGPLPLRKQILFYGTLRIRSSRDIHRS